MNPLRGPLKKWINTAWVRSLRGDYEGFLHALGSVRRTQEDYLLRLLRENAETEYGRRFRFREIKSAEAFQSKVPLTEYEDYLPFIERIARQEKNILTRAPVSLFQPSSGTSSASKYIPYTESLKSDFRRGVAPWIYALYTSIPRLASGVAYWSISPPVKEERSLGKLRVGFDHDAEYLGFIGRKLHNLVTVAPEKLYPEMDTADFFEKTLLCLLSCRDLALISIWSPSFLTNMLEYFADCPDRVLDHLADGPARRSSERAEEIRTLLESEKGSPAYQKIWPKLSLISCWTDGPCEPYIKKLKDYFPFARLQGKGLIATEAMVSFPFLDGKDPVLAVGSHFFEFRDLQTGDIRFSHELIDEREYSVIVTTGGGFYRYTLHDRVRVTGHIQGAPTLRFLTKEGFVSDLFGEKLHPVHVQSVLERAFSEIGLVPSFFLLAPALGASRPPSYTLFLEGRDPGQKDGETLLKLVEDGLRENFHYASCRDLGQLGPVHLFIIKGIGRRGMQIFTDEMVKRGLKHGDIKPVVLDRSSPWEALFRGEFMDFK